MYEISICIPTYNRSIYLKKTLNSLICQKEFKNGEVEIVVSDNCSTDNTEDMVKEYTKKYKNITYYKNDKNIGVYNFPLVLQRARGCYRKLSNDTMIYKEGALACLVKVIKKYKNDSKKPIIYYFPKDIKRKGLRKESTIRYTYQIIESLDIFVRTVSIYMTWSGGVGVWEEDVDSERFDTEGCGDLIWQVPYLLKNIQSRPVVMVTDSLTIVQEVDGKNVAYGIYKVFHDAFLKYLDLAVKKGNISQISFNKVEKDVLWYMKYWLLNFEYNGNMYQFALNDSFEKFKQSIRKTYSMKPYWKFFEIDYAIHRIYYYLRYKNIFVNKL